MRHKLLTLTFAFILNSAFAFASPVIEHGLSQPIPVPDLTTNGEWLNTAPLTAADIKGKVVLIDFWTYSCINCLRTFPYITAWHERYKDKGLVIIGVHAPEFEFEKDKANVEKALKRFKITYPVVQDNDHTLWNRFNNRYWPAHYLINRDGKIVYTHFGEGNYDVTERNIRSLLGETGDMAKPKEDGERGSHHQTHETYLGMLRMERFQPPTEKLKTDHWAISDGWRHDLQYTQAVAAGAKLQINIRGGKVFLVMGTADGKAVRVKITFDGKPITDTAGKDVKNSEVEVTDYRLYELVDLKKNGEGVVQIEALAAGLRAYAFTFGGY